ncbi:MAG: hypothetical protein MJ123_11585 [Lachnospiraceae bacterium]|nr:hypothetical protein [Lachnospiraceae bacterium]
MAKMNVNEIVANIDDSFNIFICSSSFEERSLTISTRLKNFSFNKVILLENSQGSELLKNNTAKIKDLFPNNRIDISVNLHNMLTLVNDIRDALSDVGDDCSILIDITTFTHEELLICTKILLTDDRIKEVVCLYNNAAEYCVATPLKEKWLSQGAEMIHPVWGFPGLVLPSRQTHLIVILGYESSRAFAAISDIEPASISLIYGSSSSSITDKDKEANSFFKSVLQDMAFEYNDIEEYDIPCNDPNMISEGLKNIFAKHQDKNIVVVPLNSKMSTIGVVLSTVERENVQVCYAPAIIYNEKDYSSPGLDCYIFKLKG